MEAQLIGVSGYARTGKDTFAAALVEGRGFERHSFAQPLRDLLYAQNPQLENGLPLQWAYDRIGYERLKDVSREYRRLLQALGTEGGRAILGENVWVDAAFRAVDETFATKVVFVDTRFPNEAQAVVDRGGIVVRIEREGHGPLNAHPSETALDDWSFDYVVRNNGTVPELRQKAFDLLDKEAGRFTAARYHSNLPAPQRADGPWSRDKISPAIRPHVPARMDGPARVVTENGRVMTLPSGTSILAVGL